MNDEVVLRLAEIDDAAKIIQLLQQVKQETSYLVLDPMTLTIEKEQELIARYADHPCALMVVAETAGEIIGILTLLPLATSEQHKVELGVCVLAAYWGQGIGSNLMEVGLDFAAHSDIECIELEVVKDNRAAIRLYEKFGFVKVAEQVDTIQMTYSVKK